MSKSPTDHLKARIEELEQEVTERERDLSVYRRELQQANKRLEALIAELNQELKIVHSIQRYLVPTEIPNIQGFEFSSKFVSSFVKGGDYFDIFEHEDRSRFGVIVASSTGHVMSALLLSVLLRLSGQLEARRGSAPETLVRRLIDELQPNMGAGDSVDIFYGVFDRRDFTLNFCRAGDVLALHFGHADSQLSTLKPAMPAITRDDSGELQTGSVALNPRDKLIFCTKGLAESRDMSGHEMGLDRLLKSILEAAPRSVHELRNQILFQVQKFSSGQEPPRDMTVVVAEVKDRVIKLAKK